MADGMAAGAKRDRASKVAPTTSDPVEIAMEAEASGELPIGEAVGLLAEQRRLIRWQVANEKAGLAVRALSAAAGIAIAIAALLFVWDASQDRSIVVRPFSVPPALVAKGLTGDVLAARFMDRLRYVQRAAAANSYYDARQLRDDADTLRVEIPQTGLSLDDLHQWLVRRLGNNTVIEGALWVSEDGDLTLEARVGAQPAVQVSGKAAELDRLLKTTAEGAFASTDPAMLSRYLSAVGREDEALAAARAYALSSMEAGAFSIWGFSEGDAERSVELLQKAVRLNPRHVVAQRNLVRSYLALGREQQAYDLARAALTLNDVDEPRRYRRGTVDQVKGGLRSAAALLEGDYVGAREGSVAARRNGFMPRAAILALEHDGFAAEAAVHDAELESSISAQDAALVRVRIAEAARDWSAMAERAGDLVASRRDWLSSPAYPDGPPRRESTQFSLRAAYLSSRVDAPLQATALARSGRIAEAQALITAPPVDCAPCLRAAGVVAAEAGDWRAADAWFARASAAAPRLPQAELAWGEVLLKRGDVDGAIAKLSRSAAKAPRFADPLELWGEALLIKGDAKAATDKFAEAAKLAPHWGRLHLKWGEALAAMGRPTEAQAKWKAAAHMDLTAAERAELERASGKQTA